MWKVLRISAIAMVAGAFLILYLVRFQGLRIERSGSGIWLIFSWYRAEQHIAAIEARSIPAPAETAPAVTAAPVRAEAKAQSIPAAKARAFWTDFRGPRRDGHYDDAPILTQWPADGPPRLWRRPVGAGYASLVIAGGRAFTIEQRRNKEVVAAYDLANGNEIWSHGWDAFFQESMGGDGPRATPTWDDGRIYALGAAGERRCIDANSGRRIWSKNILSDNGADNLQWGMAASPLIVDDKVIVLPGAPGKSVVAYNKLSGEPVWRVLDDKQAYTSPMLVTLGGERQIVVVSATRALGLTADGALLWEYPWSTSYDINAAQPIVAGPDSIILSAGYGHGAALVRIRKEGSAFTVTREWENTRMKNKFTSSVLHDGYLYGLDESILACLDAKTGELKWKGGRYGYGQILLASGHIIVLTEDGDIALVRATPESHQELVRFAAISGKTWNHPALSGGVLLVRNGTEMAAYRVQ
jgi:outer membrane protein assembly factor BamB